MGRFFRELRYSMRAKSHIFFLVLVWLVICTAVWLFYMSLNKELAKSFPGEGATKENVYHLVGTYDNMAQVMNTDLKAELSINKYLHCQDWMTYSEAMTEPLEIQDYKGPLSALVGYETGDVSASRDYKKKGNTYCKVKALWMDENAVRDAGLDSIALELFDTPTDYFSHMYVVVGSAYKDLVKTGDTFIVDTNDGMISVAVIGALSEGATANVDGKTLKLDSYILCPLLNMTDLYKPVEEKSIFGPNMIWMTSAGLTGKETIEALRENTESGEQKAKTFEQDTYYSYPVYYIDENEVNAENAPEWMKAMKQSFSTAPVACVAGGATYGKTGFSGAIKVMRHGVPEEFNMSYKLPEGTEYKGTVLDDYIVMYGMDYNQVYFGTTPTPSVTPTKAPDKKEGDASKDTPAATEPKEELSETETEEATVGSEEPVSFSIAECNRLMHILYMKNRGEVRTRLTANDAELTLMALLDMARTDFRKEEGDKSPITTYRIKEAAASDSILFKANVFEIDGNLKKYAPWMMLSGGLFLLLYYLRKRHVLDEYFTMLILTGTSNLEIMLLFLFESILFLVGALGLGYAFCYAVCRILGLSAVGPKSLLGTVALVVAIPTVLILARVLFTDYGKRFRRVK